MKHDQLVFEALAYRRYVGASEKDIRTHVRHGQTRKSGVKNDRASLGRLAKEGLVYRVSQKWFLTPAGQKKARGSAVLPDWQSGDSIILLSLITYSWDKGCDLVDILSGADYIDHGLPNLETVHGALNRLKSGGLMRTRGGRYFITERAMQIAKKLDGENCRKIRSRLRGLPSILDCPCCGVDLRKVSWRIVIDEAQLKEAYKAYSKRFDEA